MYTKGIRFVTIIWQEPPEQERSWRARLAPLVEQPEDWALVYCAPTPSTARSAAVRLRKRVYTVPRPTHRWEFKTSGTDVYARYIGA